MMSMRACSFRLPSPTHHSAGSDMMVRILSAGWLRCMARHGAVGVDRVGTRDFATCRRRRRQPIAAGSHPVKLMAFTLYTCAKQLLLHLMPVCNCWLPVGHNCQGRQLSAVQRNRTPAVAKALLIASFNACCGGIEAISGSAREGRHYDQGFLRQPAGERERSPLAGVGLHSGAPPRQVVPARSGGFRSLILACRGPPAPRCWRSRQHGGPA